MRREGEGVELEGSLYEIGSVSMSRLKTKKGRE
jgi:hypothetical protein